MLGHEDCRPHPRLVATERGFMVVGRIIQWTLIAAIVCLVALALFGCAESGRFPVPDYLPEAYVKRPPPPRPDASGNAAAGLAVRVPPAAYDHPYAGKVRQHYVPLVTARSMCAGHDACDWVTKDGTCHVVIPHERQAPVHDRAAYLRWETAGCNGQPDQIITLRRRR